VAKRTVAAPANLIRPSSPAGTSNRRILGYLISYESYHRGEVGIILTRSGYPLDQKTA